MERKSIIESLRSPEGGMSFITWPINRIRKDEFERLNDYVVIEEPLELLVNDQSVAMFMRMPGFEKELAAGFCISEGYVRSPKDILLIHHCGSVGPDAEVEDAEQGPESRNRIEVRVSEGGFFPPDHPDTIRLIRSGCGAADVSGMSEELPLLPMGFSVDASLILGLGKAMRELQEHHQEVGGTHSAALFDKNGGAVTAAEDIGRHNAVDKVAGFCLIRRIPLEDKVMVTSGRASYEMAVKAIRLGVPIIATVSAPTSLAVQLAQDRGLTLIGYLRGGRMNLYTHKERIRGWEE